MGPFWLLLTASKVEIRVGFRVWVVEMVHLKSWTMYFLIRKVFTIIEI